jgi:hypothetical protein
MLASWRTWLAPSCIMRYWGNIVAPENVSLKEYFRRFLKNNLAPSTRRE